MLVHQGTDHLVSSISAYLVAILPVYWLFVVRGQRRVFGWILLGIGLIVQPMVNTVYWWLFAVWLEIVSPAATARGFSAVVSALVGVLFLSTIVTIRDRWGTRLASTILCLIGSTLLGYVVLVVPEIPLLAAVVALVGVIGCVTIGLQRPRHTNHSRFRGATADEWIVETAVVSLTILLATLLPIDILEEGVFTGILAHSIGFLCGVVVTHFGLMIASRE
jgi:hypothetical protein